MVSQFGFKFQDIKDHPNIHQIQNLMKSVVQIRYKKNSNNHYLGSGFLISNNPPTLLTANHVIEEYVKKESSPNKFIETLHVIQKGVYFRINYVNETFMENKNTTYDSNQQNLNK